MATFSTNQVNALRSVADMIRELIDDVNLHFVESGLLISCMDSGHCALIKMHLTAETINNGGTGFYECTHPCSAGVNFVTLHKILRTASTDDIVTFKMSTDNPNVMTIELNSEDGQHRRDAQLALLDLDEDELEVPEVEYGAVIKTSPEKFKQILSYLKYTESSSVIIDCVKDEMRFTSEGTLMTMNRVLHANTDMEMVFNEPVHLSLSQRYMNIFSKPTALGSTVSICMHKDMPLMVAYDITGLGALRLFLAPQTEDNDE